MSLLDDHSTCITREFGGTVEAVHPTDDKDPSNITICTMEPEAPTQLLSGLEAELTNLNSVYKTYQPLIQEATQILQKEPSFNSIPVSSKHM